METWALQYANRSAANALRELLPEWLEWRLNTDRTLPPELRLYDHVPLNEKFPDPVYIGSGTFNDMAADGITPAIYLTTRVETFQNADATSILTTRPLMTGFILLGEQDTLSADSNEWKDVMAAYLEGCVRILTTRWDACSSVGVMGVEPYSMTDAVETRTPEGAVFTRVSTFTLQLTQRVPNLWPDMAAGFGLYAGPNEGLYASPNTSLEA